MFAGDDWIVRFFVSVTGRTLTILHVSHQLDEEQDIAGSLRQRFPFINAMSPIILQDTSIL